jgi:hypothetical protein
LTDSLTEGTNVTIAGIGSAGVALFRWLVSRILIGAIAGLIVKGIVTAGRALLATGKAICLLDKQREAVESR